MQRNPVAKKIAESVSTTLRGVQFLFSGSNYVLISPALEQAIHDEIYAVLNKELSLLEGEVIDRTPSARDALIKAVSGAFETKGQYNVVTGAGITATGLVGAYYNHFKS